MSKDHLATGARPGVRAARAALRALRQPVFVAAAVSALAIGLTLSEVSRAYSTERVEQAARERGSEAVRMVREMQELVGRLAGADERAQHEQTNLFYNRKIRYVSDQRLYQQVDYWASPIETFSQGRGDCEDYAIAKYFTLLAEGMDPTKLRLVYVKANLPAAFSRPAESVGHMVLAYYPEPNADPMVLDNLTDEIRPASQRPDLQPVFSFNTAGLWQGVGQQTMGDPMARISKWRDVMNRIKAEGF